MKSPSLDKFASDMEPFLHGRRSSYVGVGMPGSEPVRTITSHGIKLRAIHLVALDGDGATRLRRDAKGHLAGQNVTVHRLEIDPPRLGNASGDATSAVPPAMPAARSDHSDHGDHGDHSDHSDRSDHDGGYGRGDAGGAAVVARPKAAADAEAQAADGKATGAAPATLDELAQSFTDRRISLLQIDAGGREADVLKGAKSLLRERMIDVVHVEALMSPSAGRQPAYYRDIDDVLLDCGYGLFRVYEQTPSETQDLPFLKRVGLAYMSPTFAASNPFRLTQELYGVRTELDRARAKVEELHRTLAEAEQRGVGLETQVAQLQGELDASRKKVADAEAAAGRQPLVESLQNRLATLESASRQARDDAQRQLEAARGEQRAAAERLDETTRLLQEARRQQATLEGERAELQARMRAAEQERAASEQASGEAQVHLRRELDAERAATQAAGERTRALEAEIEQAQDKDRRAQQSKAASDRRLRELEDDLGASRRRLLAIGDEVTTLRQQLSDERKRVGDQRRERGSDALVFKDVVRLLDESKLSERRAQADARVAAFRQERIRRQLPFRLGTTLIADARPPWRFVRLPADLAATYRAYRADKAGGLLAPLAPVSAELPFRKGRLALVVKHTWQQVAIPEAMSPIEVWAHTLHVGESESVGAVFETDCDGVRTQLALAAAAHPAPRSAKAVTPGTIALRPGSLVRLFHHQGPACSLHVRNGESGPFVLKLELRAASIGTLRERAAAAAAPLSSPARPAAPPAAGTPPVAAAFPARATSGAAATLPTRLAASRGDDPGPAPLADAILWQAAQLIDAGRIDQGIAFAHRHARAFVRPAVRLLEANRAHGDEAQWLEHVNAYVATFGIAPVALTPAQGSVFSRLTAAAPAVEQGPLVSVIMPAYQAEASVRMAARSILGQTWRPLELIIVDDASTDGTWPALQALAREDARVTLLRNRRNVGPYVSKNFALAAARGDYITGHDADDWAHPQRLERHVGEMLRAAGGLEASMTRMLRLDERGYFVHFAKEGKASDDGALRDAAISCLFRSSFLRGRLGFWDSVRFGADSEMVARAQRVAGAAFANLRQLGMFCQDLEGSLTNDPVHGVSKTHGVSPARVVYREAWKAWHRSSVAGDCRLPFPHTDRRFPAPAAAVVTASAIAEADARAGVAPPALVEA